MEDGLQNGPIGNRFGGECAKRSNDKSCELKRYELRRREWGETGGNRKTNKKPATEHMVVVRTNEWTLKDDPERDRDRGARYRRRIPV